MKILLFFFWDNFQESFAESDKPPRRKRLCFRNRPVLIFTILITFVVTVATLSLAAYFLSVRGK